MLDDHAERHQNEGPCTRCGERAPRYGKGFDDRGASPLCFTCQEKLTFWRKDQKAKRNR